MKSLLIILLILSIHVLARTQGEIRLDAKTMKIDDRLANFKVNEYISFKIFNLSQLDSFELEFESNDNFNQAAFEKFTSFGNTITEVSQQDTFYALSFRIENKDITKIKLVRYQNKIKIEERNYTYRNSGGIKFDVSSGFFWTNLKDEIYVLQKVSDTENQIICENNGEGRIGIGLLTHLHSRTSSWFNYGANIGFELNNDSKVSYLAGLSLIFGYDRKLLLNGGLAISKINVISNLYQDKGLIPNNITSIPLVNIWKAGYFIGMTYNF